MLVGALGVEAVSGLYQALRGHGGNQDAAPFQIPGIEPVSLTAPQPPDGETAISKAASKVIADLKSLLLGVQAANGDGSSGATDPAAAAGPAKAGGHHHHHHHGGGSGSATATSTATTVSATATNQSDAVETGLAQLTKALSAYTQPARSTAASTQSIA